MAAIAFRLYRDERRYAARRRSSRLPCGGSCGPREGRADGAVAERPLQREAVLDLVEHGPLFIADAFQGADGGGGRAVDGARRIGEKGAKRLDLLAFGRVLGMNVDERGERVLRGMRDSGTHVD